jgi:hypothetical protein
MQGTSMAAPNIAGTVALIEHYLTAFYPRRVIAPTASLLRALLLNSADQVPAISKSYAPNNDVGFGQVNLGRYLPKPGDPFVLIVNNSVVIPQGGHLVTQVNVTNTTAPLRITIAYIDQPGSPDSFLPLLTDLDLVVVSPTGKVFRGNHHPNNTEEHYSTTERVIVDDVEIGEYLIHVLSKSDLIPEVSFSIALIGPVETLNYTLPFEAATQCLTCGGDGTCGSDTHCVCGATSVGRSCQIPVNVLQPPQSESLSLLIQPLEIAYVVVKPLEPGKLKWSVETDEQLALRVYAAETQNVPLVPFEYDNSFWNATDVAGEGIGQVVILIRNDLETVQNYTVSASSEEVVSPSSTTVAEDGSNVGMIVGVVIGSLVLVAIVIVAVWFIRRKRQQSQDFKSIPNA